LDIKEKTRVKAIAIPAWQKSPMLTTAASLQIETDTTAGETADLAQRALGPGVLPDAYFRWLGEIGYGEPAIQIGAYDGSRKIGHVAISPQDAFNRGQTIRIGHVIDLFIDPERRSVMTVQALYRKAMAEMKARGFDVVAAVPNTAATQIDQFFLKVKPLAPLPITMVPATPFGASARVIAAEPGALARFLTSDVQTGAAWSPLTLAARLSRPDRIYLPVTDGEALCIVSPRRFKGLPMALICGMFSPKSASRSPHGLRKLAADAAALAGMWAAIYVGRNTLPGMPPGLALPDAIRPSPMVPHFHGLTPKGEGYAPERFESIDFDFA
jgi:hypothetical protein